MIRGHMWVMFVFVGVCSAQSIASHVLNLGQKQAAFYEHGEHDEHYELGDHMKVCQKSQIILQQMVHGFRACYYRYSL